MSLSKLFDEKSKNEKIINEAIFVHDAAKYFLNEQHYIKNKYNDELFEYINVVDKALYKCDNNNLFKQDYGS
jgi:hypothetical protein